MDKTHESPQYRVMWMINYWGYDVASYDSDAVLQKKHNLAMIPVENVDDKIENTRLMISHVRLHHSPPSPTACEQQKPCAEL